MTPSSPISENYPEQRKQTGRFLIVLLLFCVFAAVLGLLNLMLGSVSLSWQELGQAFTEAGRGSTAYKILFEIRLPRLLAAFLLGGALAVSGFLLQTFFANPLAGPFVLGISSGAKLTVALYMICTLQTGFAVSSGGMIAAAFLGAGLSMGFVMLVSGRVRSAGILIVCGIMIGYFCSAVTELFITFADDSNIVNLHSWSQGSFSGVSMDNIRMLAPILLVSLAGCILLAKPMGAYQLGELYAVNSGVHVARLRICLILLSSLLSACVTAFAGPVAFVGIAVPQLTRRLLRTDRPIRMIPACFLAGAAFCLLADLLARLLFAPTELSISLVTSILGAPVVIKIMTERRLRHA